MSRKKPDGEGLKCSFCGKSQKDVRKLIAGPTVYICDECIEICNGILKDDAVEPRRGGAGADKENATRYLERAKNELEAARLLLEGEFARVCAEVARASARSALQAFLVY